MHQHTVRELQLTTYVLLSAAHVKSGVCQNANKGVEEEHQEVHSHCLCSTAAINQPQEHSGTIAHHLHMSD